MANSRIYIGRAAENLGVSIETLRRWDKSGRLHANKSEGGQRWYYQIELDKFKYGIFGLADLWAGGPAQTPYEEFYCPSTTEFKGRLSRLQNSLEKTTEYKDNYSLIVAVAGEIGNNSYDHNLGNWPDIQGTFFAYDVVNKQIALADRGLGVLTTLRRIKPNIATDKEALDIAFTEIISGRAPESRGNGLKFVRQVVLDNAFKLIFFSGNAAITIDGANKAISVYDSGLQYSGCLALVSF